MRFDAFAAEWLWSQALLWRPATVAAYTDHLLRLCACPFSPTVTLGTTRVRELTERHVEVVVPWLRHEGFAPATVRACYRVLRTLPDRASGKGLLIRPPVTAEVRQALKPFLKSAGMDEPKAFTREQAQRFLEVTADNSRLHAFYLTGFLTGLRLGELTALQLADDQARLVGGQTARQLRVERAFTQLSSMRNPIPGPTKTGKSRWVDIAADLGALFDRIKRERQTLAMRHGWRPVPQWMFPTQGGCPYGHANVAKDFHRMLTLAGLEGTGLSVHSMRHSFASWHIAKNCNPKWLQQQLGHSSITITLDVYGDWFKLHDAAAADELASGLLGNRAGNRQGA